MGRRSNIHDGFYKALFGDPAMIKSLLAAFGPRDIVAKMDLASLVPYRSEFSGDMLHERRGDLVWKVKFDKGYCYLFLVLEFQSTQDWWMAVRIAVYTTMLYQEIIKTEKLKQGDKLPPVLPIVLYNGKKPWDAPLSLRELLADVSGELARYQPDMEYYLLDEGRLNQSGHGGSRGLVPLVIRFEQAANLSEALSVLKDLAELMDESELQRLDRLFLNWLAESIFRRTEFSKEIKSCTTIREAYMRLADIAPDWEEYFMAKGRQEGRDMGLLEGRAMGLQEGRAAGMKQFIKDIVNLRFSRERELDGEIEKIDDPAKLQSLYDFALGCSTREEFVAELSRLIDSV